MTLLRPLAVFAAALSLSASALAAPGTLDRSFGNQGIATFDFTPEEFRNDHGIDMVLQPDGKMVVLDATSNNYAVQYIVSRHLADGTLDASFGIGGRFTLDGGSCLTCFDAAKIARRADGAFIVAGTRPLAKDGNNFRAEMVAIRLTAGGTLDATFGVAGYARVNPEGYSPLSDMVLQADDRIVLAGATGPGNPLPPDPLFELMPPQPAPGRWVVARLGAGGLPDATFGPAGIAASPFAAPSAAHAVAIQSDGRIAAAGPVGNNARLLRYDATDGATSGGVTYTVPGAGAPTVIDIAPGSGGSVFLAIARGGTPYLLKALENASDPTFIVFPRDASTLTPTAQGGVLVGAPEEVVKIAANGYPDDAFADQGRLAIAGLDVRRLAILPDGRIVGTGALQGASPTLRSLALFRIDPTATEFVVTQWIEFPAQSIGTRSYTRHVTITNTTGATINITTSLTDGFGANECVQIAAGASCRLAVYYYPGHTTAGFSFAEAQTGQLMIMASSGATATVRLDAIVEKSLVRHYYRYILGREAEQDGALYWAAEARRIRNALIDLSASTEVNPAEVWYAMGLEFFRSPEYKARLVGNGTYIDDLYQAFFDRSADFEGRMYWMNQLDAGLPREALLATFMLSPEFAQFNARYFGAAPNRPEIDVVFDMYRGLLGRLPDEGGLRYWVDRLQAAQCASPARIYAEVEAISSQFSQGPEYAARGRTTTDFVVDLYNAFMRRGADLPGLQFWVQRIDSGAVSRDTARQQFMTSPEFSARVQAVVSAGCL